jgi:CRISPR-associated protein Cmr6
MRSVLRNLGTPDHPGLAYEVWANVDGNTGKIADSQIDAWLEAVTGIAVNKDYARAFERWKQSFADDRSRLAEMTLASRLLIGHGNAAATDVGLTLHRTWGVPMIPGSALKGLLAHYVETLYGPEVAGRAPDDPALSVEEQARARFQGVMWRDRRPLFGPGEVYGALFGSPDVEGENGQGLAKAARGGVIFHDALYVPGSVANDEPGEDKPLATDVLTVHQKAYYDSKGQSTPSDYDSPNPVRFLTVRPGTRFLIAVSGPTDWTELAIGLLERALSEWGVGGKTSLGYGRASRFEPVTVRPQVRSEVVAEFSAWLNGQTGDSPRRRLKRVQDEWLNRLRSLSLPEREAAAELIRKTIRRSRIGTETDQLIAELLADSEGSRN